MAKETAKEEEGIGNAEEDADECNLICVGVGDTDCKVKETRVPRQHKSRIGETVIVDIASKQSTQSKHSRTANLKLVQEDTWG